MAEFEVLSEGATGEFVSNLQQALQDLGFDPGEIHGSYGPATKAAVMAFQQMHGLEVDGIVGPITSGTIDQAVKDRSTL